VSFAGTQGDNTKSESAAMTRAGSIRFYEAVQKVAL
jgi:preprotein translocase subunit Sec61beta